jgi:hypothetical protein
LPFGGGGCEKGKRKMGKCKRKRKIGEDKGRRGKKKRKWEIKGKMGSKRVNKCKIGIN